MTKQHHTGSCQCGAIAFEVDLDLSQTVVCNCSRCRRLGSVLAFAPREEFQLTKDGATTEYLFNKQQIEHRFCPVCGIEAYSFGSMPDGTRMVAVNVNCLDDVDARSLDSKPVDGASA
ncbi:GFA family protein [Paracoccus pacificus]|uniref:GFA family protein n=1 Tax=Paracoccus pacificus TaxID=1463598 RepID=A0ABW4RC74_9RHOB